MVILEYPIEFGLLPKWLEESQHPVLDNECAREVATGGYNLNLVPEAEAVERIDRGERVYTSSETALDWIETKTHADQLKRAIELCKDKAAFREALAPIDPEMFFRRCSAADVLALDFDELPVPFVMKPDRGYCSVGVHVVRNRADWEQAQADVRAGSINSVFSQSVVDSQDFILESFIDGTEYALDLFYDAEGRAHVLNVLRHDFDSPEDTSDRLYLTGVTFVEMMRPMFEEWFDKANDCLRFRNFCVHAEVRVRAEDNCVRPIEFNPLRFAGMGGTDISQYAYGYYTYASYLEDRLPDTFVPKSAQGKVFAMSFIMPPAGLEHARFDINRFCAHLDHVLEARLLDTKNTGAWAFIFAEEPVYRVSRLNFLGSADLADFALPE